MAKPKLVKDAPTSKEPQGKKNRLRYANVMTLVVTVLIASGVSYVEIVQPSLPLTKTANAPEKQEATATSSPTSTDKSATVPADQSDTKTNTPSPEGSPSAGSASSTAVATPAVKTATTVSFVHMRAGKGTSTAVVADLDGGTVVQLRDDADPTWQGVTYNGKVGYIYKEYLHY